MSMGDFFDNEVPPEWREDAWRVIRETPNLRWMILTKRIGNAAKMLPDGFPSGYEHVGMMATIANQEEADRDIIKLLRLKRRFALPWVGISVEPMLGPIDLEHLDLGEDWLDALTGERFCKAPRVPSTRRKRLSIGSSSVERAARSARCARSRSRSPAR
jgi:protein gp37